MGTVGSDQASTVVVRPPMYEERSKTVMLLGVDEEAAYCARW